MCVLLVNLCHFCVREASCGMQGRRCYGKCKGHLIQLLLNSSCAKVSKHCISPASMRV